ncbi:MAG: hypothetical protein ACTH7C_07175, partial [Cobetia marina]
HHGSAGHRQAVHELDGGPTQSASRGLIVWFSPDPGEQLAIDGIQKRGYQQWQPLFYWLYDPQIMSIISLKTIIS